MEIILHDGKEEIMLRGKDGTFEICWKVNIKAPGTTEAVATFIPQRWYSSIPGAIDAILKLKVSNCEAKSLEELKEQIKSFRKELLAVYV
jgi:hypothetical protein